jgi:hypothetical protein
MFNSEKLPMQVTGLENDDDQGRKVMDVTWGTLMQLYLQNLSLRTDSRQRIMNSHWALIFDPFSQLWQLLLKQVEDFVTLTSTWLSYPI